MQTIDIAQAIKDNSANVSQNLDPSVLEGLLPVVTISNKGFMSADLYKYSVKSFNITGTGMAKLYTKSNSSWVRKGGLICLSDESKGSLYSFCVVEISGAPTKFSVYKIFGDDSRIEFYQKNSELYVYFNTEARNNISLIGFSSGNIVHTYNTLDGTFTKVEVS